MTSRMAAVLRMVAGALACAAALVPIAVVGQAPADSRTGGWTAPKTPWGEPDLEGRWPVTHLMGTPLQRDDGVGREGVLDRGRDGGPPQAGGRAGNAYREAISSGNFGAALRTGVTDPGTPQRQTSLIVDPPDGRLPDLTAEGKRLSALMKSTWSLSPGRGPGL